MSTDRVPPHDLGAELALLGDLMLFSERLDEVAETVDPSDFYGPAHGAVFAALLSLRNEGTRRFDAVAVRDALRRSGDESAASAVIAATGAGGGSTAKYAAIVLDCSARRRIISSATETAERAYDPSATAEDVLDRAMASLGSIDMPRTSLPDGVFDLDRFLDDPPHEVRRPWLVPGLIRFGWRVLIVAQEGAGKSLALRQVAICAAQGIDPFRFGAVPPVRTLIVDLENPHDPIYETCKPIRDRAMSVKGDAYEPGRAWLWSRPGGVNIRTRTDRGRLEAVIARTRPDLVCLGPLYKTFRKTSREGDEEAAQDAAEALDSLRTRHDFALLLEHHAPKQQNGKRELLPFGSSVWLRWPELGLKLKPPGPNDPAGSLVVGRFREDRVKCNWPDRLDRGTTGWAWEGRWSGPYGVEEPQPVLEEF